MSKVSQAGRSVEIEYQLRPSDENPLLQDENESDLYGSVDSFAETYGLTEDLAILRRAAAFLKHEEEGNDSTVELSTAESTARLRERTHKWRQPRTLWFVIFCCSLGAVEQGWAQTGMNGANLYIPKALHIDSGSHRDALILGLINCGIYLAQAGGCWLAQPVNDRFGRKGATWLAALLCLLGNLSSAISGTWPLLLACRLVSGIGLGLSSSTVAVLAGECAPAYIRGGLAVSWQMFTALGIFLGFLANLTFSNHGPDIVWRLQLGAPLIPTMPLLILIPLLPESPAWLAKFGKYDKALASLYQLRNTKLQAAAELYGGYLTRRKAAKLSSNGVESITFFAKVKSLFAVPRNRHAVYASYTVMLSQQLCGINVIAFYGTTVFAKASESTSAQAALWASVIFGFVNFLGAFPAVWTMDVWGRRPLLLWTLPAMAATMALISLTFGLPTGNTQLYLLAGLVYLFCALYSPGVGPVPVAYSAEIYPSSVREVGMSFAISTASCWATVLSVTFPLLLAGLGERSSFSLYSALNVLAFALCWTFVRETKGVELEKMDAIFERSAGTFIADMWADRPNILACGIRSRQGWKEIGQNDLGET